MRSPHHRTTVADLRRRLGESRPQGQLLGASHRCATVAPRSSQFREARPQGQLSGTNRSKKNFEFQTSETACGRCFGTQSNELGQLRLMAALGAIAQRTVVLTANIQSRREAPQGDFKEYYELEIPEHLTARP